MLYLINGLWFLYDAVGVRVGDRASDTCSVTERDVMTVAHNVIHTSACTAAHNVIHAVASPVACTVGHTVTSTVAHTVTRIVVCL